MGGGNDQTTTTSSSISDQFMPDLTSLVNTAKSEYDSGNLSNVAGASNIQNSVFSAAGGTENTGLDAIAEGSGVGRDAIAGNGVFNVNAEGLKTAAVDRARSAWAPINDQQATAGVTGGSRSMLQEGARDAQLANELAGIDYQAGQEQRDLAKWGSGTLVQGGQAEAGTTLNNLSGLASLGDVQRNITQEGLDANALGLERYSNVFGALTGSNQDSTSVTSGGGK